jgi:hypothetical protein
VQRFIRSPAYPQSGFAIRRSQVSQRRAAAPFRQPACQKPKLVPTQSVETRSLPRIEVELIQPRVFDL